MLMRRAMVTFSVCHLPIISFLRRMSSVIRIYLFCWLRNVCNAPFYWKCQRSYSSGSLPCRYPLNGIIQWARELSAVFNHLARIDRRSLRYKAPQAMWKRLQSLRGREMYTLIYTLLNCHGLLYYINLQVVFQMFFKVSAIWSFHF